HSYFRVAEMATAQVLVHCGFRPRDDDQVAGHTASVRFVRWGCRSGKVGDHLPEQRAEKQEMHFRVATLSRVSSFNDWSGLYTPAREHSRENSITVSSARLDGVRAGENIGAAGGIASPTGRHRRAERPAEAYRARPPPRGAR